MKRVVVAAALWAAASGAVEAQQVRQMLNGFRAEQGMGPVTPSPLLEEAAMSHALDMARNGFFAHSGSDGSDVMERVRRSGYGACVIAENIAQGQGDLTEVLGDWVASPPHRRNLLNPQITGYGLVRADGNIWVMVLGRDGC